MKQIPSAEINFHPNSFGDSDGRLFFWQGQLYRGIDSAWAPFLDQLFRDGLIQKLVNRGLLIDTELAPLRSDSYELIVRHQTIPFPAYTHEWCAAMLKDAALTILDLSLELAHSGLALKDAHPWNVLFDASRPLYVDLTSISPLSTLSHIDWHREFCHYVLYPLLLMAEGQERIARWLLWDYDGVTKSDFQLLTRRAAQPSPTRSSRTLSIAQQVWQRTPQRFHHILKAGSAHARSIMPKRFSYTESHLDFLRSTRKEVAAITLLAGESRQPAPLLPAAHIAEKAKYDTLRQILAEKSPETVLDVGHQTGWLSILAAKMGSRVVSFSDDSRDTEALYENARRQALPILPLVMDFARPTPARGLDDHCYIAASERFQCDMVLALSLLPQLTLHRHLNFDQIVSGLADFSRRWVVAEFLPYPDQACRQEIGQRIPWYTLDNFANALRRRFRDVRILPASSEASVLLICEK